MNVDEMDLAGQALDVTPWRPEAYERARMTLRGAMAESGSLTESVPLPERASVPAVAPLRGRGTSLAGHRRRRTLGTRGKVGIGAGIGAIAAAVAGVLVVTSTPQSSVPTGSASTTTSPLMTLAADLVADPKPTGDATLVERETGAPGKAASIKVWDLYSDDGRYFFSRTKAGLPAQVKKDNNQGDGMFAREVAAATYAAKGNLDTALLKMAWAPDTTPVPAWLSVQLKDLSAGGTLDNYVWENSEDVLVAGAGNPQVRAGVLRLVSALPDITVTHGTVGGQPTLTLTSGPDELGYTGPKAGPKAKGETSYQEAITINAKTGIPLGIATGPVGKVTATVTYVVTRVSLADIAAGKS